ncbi:unnamed protein product [Sphagnum jensenii]|uniref:Uncharacterized protein n=1 Tax=Sphagnum jensenii TaxID=128206 RepID=A0ABP0X6Q2_9BRYO
MDLIVDLIEFVILADIVDTIICDIFFHNDEQLLNDSDNDDDTTMIDAIAKRNIFDIIDDESVWAILLAGDSSTHHG